MCCRRPDYEKSYQNLIRDEKLLLREKPYSDESLLGYIIRLTSLNDYDTPTWITRCAKLGYIGHACSLVLNDYANLELLSRLSGTDINELQSLLYKSSDGSNGKFASRLIFGQSVPSYVIRVWEPKICQACIRESEYCRKVWDLIPITACPIHNCLLLDKCPKCQKRLSWVRGSIGRCPLPCGYYWHDAELQFVGDSELAVARQVYKLCGLSCGNTTSNEALSTTPLFQLTLENLTRSLLFIASQFHGVIDTKGKRFSFLTNGEIHNLLRKASLVFANWPDSYFSFLDWRRAQSPAKKSAYGLRKDFAEYKSALYKQLSAPQLDFMRVDFEEYLIKQWDGGYATQVKRLDAVARNNGKYISRREAKDLLKVGVISIDKLIAIGRLKANVRKQGNTRLILIERASVMDFKYELDHSLYLKQVQRLLGLSYKRVLELVTYELLNPLRGPFVDRCSDWRFSNHEVRGLLNKIKEKVQPCASVETEGTIGFLMALRKLRYVPVLMGQFIQDIFSGEVYPCDVNTKPGLNAFQFSKKEITGYADKQLGAQ